MRSLNCDLRSFGRKSGDRIGNLPGQTAIKSPKIPEKNFKRENSKFEIEVLLTNFNICERSEQSYFLNRKMVYTILAVLGAKIQSLKFNYFKRILNICERSEQSYFLNGKNGFRNFGYFWRENSKYEIEVLLTNFFICERSEQSYFLNGKNGLSNFVFGAKIQM